MDPIELLLNLLIDGGQWPPRKFAARIKHVRTMRAFLEAEREDLRAIADWPDKRPYKVDALPGLMADAWADHLWSEDPEITPANDTDTDALEFILEGNEDLVGDLHNAERQVAGIGEYWWRALKDADIADVPLLDWHDADVVFPYFVGRRLKAVGLVTELDRVPRARTAVWRHFELHTDGLVEHVLFRGTKSRIGSTVPLETHPDLVELAASLGAANGQGQVWTHGLPSLMGRITNGRKRAKKLGELGVSDFYGIEDDLLDLNESKTIGGENMRLTAKKRAIIPEDSVERQGPELVDNGDGSFIPVNRNASFDAGEDVLVVSKLDTELGRGSASPFQVLEYSFDAEPLLAWKRDLIESALTRRGLTPQYVGVITGEGDGLALSGTALRLRLIPTTKAGNGKARPWDDSLPVMLSLLQRLDAMAEDEGGFGRADAWTDPQGIPAVERANALPHDEVEDATIESTLVSARIRSRFQAVKSQHPDWTDDQVNEELDRIDGDTPAAPSAIFGA